MRARNLGGAHEIGCPARMITFARPSQARTPGEMSRRDKRADDAIRGQMLDAIGTFLEHNDAPS